MNRPSLSARHGLALWLASGLILGGVGVPPAHGMDEAASPSHAFLIVVDGQGGLSVKEVNGTAVELAPGSRGLIVWENGGQERWAFLGQGGRWAREELERNTEGAAMLSAATRGRGPAETVAGGNGSIPSTTFLVPLLGSSVMRGNSPFLTPSNGPLIGPRITIRRRPAPQGPPFPKQRRCSFGTAISSSRSHFPKGSINCRGARSQDYPPRSRRGYPPASTSFESKGEANP